MDREKKEDDQKKIGKNDFIVFFYPGKKGRDSNFLKRLNLIFNRFIWKKMFNI